MSGEEERRRRRKKEEYAVIELSSKAKKWRMERKASVQEKIHTIWIDMIRKTFRNVPLLKEMITGDIFELVEDGIFTI